jgi:hypothetical protein
VSAWLDEIALRKNRMINEVVDLKNGSWDIM